MKRALDCFCGVYLEGDNDEELLNWTRAHVSRKHSDMGLTDEQIRKMVEEEAYDTQGKAQEKNRRASEKLLPRQLVFGKTNLTGS